MELYGNTNIVKLSKYPTIFLIFFVREMFSQKNSTFISYNAPVSVNSVGGMLTQGILTETCFSQNPHPAMNFHFQSPIPKDRYFYHL